MIHDWRGLQAPGVGPFDLAVAGHTHGGQVCIPWTGYCPRTQGLGPYLSGRYAWPGGGVLYVNRGLGETKFHLRLACRPEVTVLDLRPQ